ncbi:hypothetical protein CPB86DRAFT_357855 [Serendipita vermifera]|nr:hypothetical protein CPB86DRAFT_357855 [Serendipita vermifera]
MKFSTVLVTLTVLASGTLASSNKEPNVARAPGEDPAKYPELVKRQCNYDTSCKGYGWSVGLHCGDGNFGCIKGNVYQIGSATNVCDYGDQTSCQRCNKLDC